jgi:chromosome partitioning protein
MTHAFKTIVAANQKGGTGKTTTAVTLAHGLAQEGRRVLIVDTDVQGHVSKALGLQKMPGVSQLVRWYQGLDDLLVVQGRTNLNIIPSDKSTEAAKRILAGVDFREQVLATALEELGSHYDVVVIDCAPSVDVLHVAALVAGDWLVVPTKLDYLAVDGVREVLGSLAALKKRRVSAPQVLGILPTFYDRTTNETLAQLKRLVNAFGNKVLPPIPVDTKLREAPAYGETVWEYAPKTRSVVGVSLNGKGRKAGGYVQFLERVKAVLDG